MRIYEPCVCCEYPCGHVAHRSKWRICLHECVRKAVCHAWRANGNIRAPCIPLMVDPLRGAPPASSAARQEALSLRGGACEIVCSISVRHQPDRQQNEEWGWIKRSHVMIYRDGKGDEATQSCWTTALYTYYIHITTKITCKAVPKKSRLYLLHPRMWQFSCISMAVFLKVYHWHCHCHITRRC